MVSDLPGGVEFQEALRVSDLLRLHRLISCTYRPGAGVWGLVGPALAQTLGIVFGGLGLAMLLSLAALWAGSRSERVDAAAEIVAGGLSSVPAFVAAAVVFRLGMRWMGLRAGWPHALVAILVLAVADGVLVDLLRTLRADLYAADRLDFVRQARANADQPRRHLFRALCVPVSEICASRFTLLLGTAIVVELALQMPGVGVLLWVAAAQRDVPVVVATTLSLAACVAVLNMVRDLFQLIADPRLRRLAGAR